MNREINDAVKKVREIAKEIDAEERREIQKNIQMQKKGGRDRKRNKCRGKGGEIEKKLKEMKECHG